MGFLVLDNYEKNMTTDKQYVFKRLEISGYKSIQDVVIEDIPPLMVLAGSNGSGKSNFVDSLEFLSTLITENVEKVTKNFDTKFTLNFKFEQEYATYILNLKNNTIVYEELNYVKDEEIIKYPRDLMDLQIEKINKQFKSIFKTDNEKKELTKILDFLQNKETLEKIVKESIQKVRSLSLIQRYREEIAENEYIDNMISKISNIKIFRINHLEAKKPSIDSQLELNSDGSNIASILAQLENNDEIRETILEWLCLIVPEMQNIVSDNRHIDGSKIIQFEEEGNRKFPAHLVSDGTIYALCILVAVLTRTQKPGITIIEEPERGLHPKAIGELVSFMREHATAEHPIILTTHSESVVRELELDELFFVSKENGKTQIESVKDSGVDKNKIPLDTAWLTNTLGGGLPW